MLHLYTMFVILRYACSARLSIKVHGVHVVVLDCRLLVIRSVTSNVEIFLDMPVILTDFENLVNPNNKICSLMLIFGQSK